MSSLPPLLKNNLPPALPFKKLIGPSFIILGVGLGSGELILWPYLASNFGLGIIWAAVLGISFQFFINMEIERYTLVCGESIFVGLTRKFGRFSPVWFILTTFIPWMWPGIIASSALLFSHAMGIKYSGLIGIAFLIVLGIFYSMGRIIYKTQEKIQKLIILIGVPFVLLITLYVSKGSDWATLAQGLVGRGEGFWFLPKGLPIATFLAALAYAGAGGNLNLAQSLYIKEKGYGMGAFSGHITNILSGKKERLSLTGTTFEPNLGNMVKFKSWWHRINVEHAIIFWATGAFTMLLLSLLAYSTTYGSSGVETSINFVLFEAGKIASQTVDILGTFFLLISALMLFGTQFSVFGSNARIMSENLVLLSPNKFKVEKLHLFFFAFLGLQILAGIIIFALGFTEPLTLVITGAILNAFSMFIYTGLVLSLNLTSLDKALRPSSLRIGLVLLAFLFYGAFSIFTIVTKLL